MELKSILSLNEMTTFLPDVRLSSLSEEAENYKTKHNKASKVKRIITKNIAMTNFNL